MNPYWLLRAVVKTPNISHATTTGLESAGEKQLNLTVPELIENLLIFKLFYNPQTGLSPTFFILIFYCNLGYIWI